MVERDDPRVAAARRGVPVTERLAYLNAGSHGPLAAAAARAISELAEAELTEGRTGTAHFRRMRELRAATRAEFARVLGCAAADVALTTSTTAGMNFALWGLDWRAGDEVVTTDVEHFGGLGPLYTLVRRYGVEVRFAETRRRGVDALAAIEAALGPRTRAVVVSHVSWSAGVVLPLAAIAERAHAVGALVIADGAQAAGAIPVDVRALGVDAYAVPGQKWLCGPEGLGALYVAPERLAELAPSYVGMDAFAAHDDYAEYALVDDARRFSTPGNPYGPSVAGMRASLRWLLDDVGLAWACERVVEGAARCRAVLERIPGVAVLTPSGRHAGLLHFNLAGWHPTAVEQELLRRRVLVRSMVGPPCVRASVGFYNDEGDLQALAAGLEELRRLPPHPPEA
jgi:L-cysteine/cystine lyase